MSDEQLIAMKDRAAAAFLEIPGVTAVGLGGRERAGRRTGELCIKVFVAHKRPAEELTPGELLPPAFEGMGVDVSVLGEVEPQMGTPIPKEIPPGSLGESSTDGTNYRPLTGGARVEVDLSGSGLGTGGSVWRNVNNNDVYLLTNFHVVSAGVNLATLPTRDVTRVGQSTSSSGPTECCNDIIGTFAGGGRNPLRDAALIRLDPGTRYLAEVKCVGVVAGTYDIKPATDVALPIPYPVRKYGAKTRLTGGTVDSVANVQTIRGVRFTNTMIVSPNPNPALRAHDTLFWSDEGDSGSAVVNDDNKIVGLHFAGDKTGPVRRGVALPIKDIIDQFNTVEHIEITPATAGDNGEVQTVPGGHPVAAPPRELERVLTAALPDYASVLARVGADLESSAAGRDLRALWADHHAELLDLVGHRRRVTVAWHRGGGPALLHTLVRMAADPALAMPSSVNGVPPMDRLTSLHAVFRAHASPGLRRALDHALGALPDPADLTYDQLVAAIATR